MPNKTLWPVTFWIEFNAFDGEKICNEMKKQNKKEDNNN